jgi:hypothetical protein
LNPIRLNPASTAGVDKGGVRGSAFHVPRGVGDHMKSLLYRVVAFVGLTAISSFLYAVPYALIS